MSIACLVCSFRAPLQPGLVGESELPFGSPSLILPYSLICPMELLC